MPSIVTPQAMSTFQNSPVTNNVLTGSSDADGHILQVTLTDNPTNGVAQCTPGGACTYKPSAGFTGVDSFDFKVSDGHGGQVRGTVNVTVIPNSPPFVVTPRVVNTVEDTPVTTAVLTGASDPEGDSIAVVARTDGAKGLVTCTPAGACTYVPKPNRVGADSYTYWVSDGKGLGGLTKGKVNVTITPVNDPPVVLTPQMMLAVEGNPSGKNVLLGAADPDGDPITVVSKTDGQHGTVVCTPGGFCSYTPIGNFFGDDSFTFTASDGLGGNAVGTVNVTVISGDNDGPPSIDTNQILITAEDTPGTKNVLAGAFDPDGGPLAVTAWTQGMNGTVACTAAGACTYTPDPEWSGVDFFQFRVDDVDGNPAFGTVTVTVNSVNDPPTIVTPRAVGTTEETPTSPIDVLAGAMDPDGGSVSLSAWTNGTSGSVTCTVPTGFCVYTPNTNFSGSDSFTFTVTDGQGGDTVGTVNVTVVGINDPPVIVTPRFVATDENIAVTTNVLDGSFDPDGDTLTVIAWTQGAGGIVECSAAGACTYTPDPDFVGSDSFTFTVADGIGPSVIGTVFVAVGLLFVCYDPIPNPLPAGYLVIVGTDGDDNLVGGPSKDIILGGAGDDQISGGGGDDILCGGDGHDRIDGGDGNDLISGGGGRDRIAGGRGDDDLCLDAADPPPFTGPGTDTLLCW